MFGLTGAHSLPSCYHRSAALPSVKEVALSCVLVLCFGIGLALTLVTVRAAAAIGAIQASSRWPWLSTVVRRAPYLSSLLIIAVGLAVGLYVGLNGWIGLSAQVGVWVFELASYLGLFLVTFCDYVTTEAPGGAVNLGS